MDLLCVEVTGLTAEQIADIDWSDTDAFPAELAVLWDDWLVNECTYL